MADQTNSSAPSPGHVFDDTAVGRTDLGRRITAGGVFGLSTSAIRSLITLVTTAALARLLTPDDFGLFAMAVGVTGFVGLFGNIGIPAAIVRSNTVSANTANALFALNLAVGVVIGGTMILLASPAATLFGEPRLVPLVSALACLAPFHAIANYYKAICARRMMWAALSAILLASQALSTAAAIALAAATSVGVWALAVQQAVALAVTLSVYAALVPWRPGRVTGWREAAAPIGFGLYLGGYGLVNYFHRQIDNILVGMRWGAVDLGFYSRAYNLFMLPLTALVWPLIGPLTSGMSRLQDDPARWARTYLAWLAPVSVLAAGLSGVLVLGADAVVLVLFGDQWLEVVPIFRCLSLTMGLQPALSSAGVIFITLGRTRRKFWGSFAVSGTFLCAFLIGLPFGPTGVAAGYAAAFVVVLPGWILLATRGTALGLTPILAVALPPMAALWLAVGATLALEGLAPQAIDGVWALAALRCALFGAAYLGLVAALRSRMPAFRDSLTPALALAAERLRAVFSLARTSLRRRPAPAPLTSPPWRRTR